MPDYTVYYMPTPNGKKVSLALEEMGLSYDIEHINIMNNDQFTEEFIKINPNSKIPALVDHTADDLVVFESGAILEYLAEKTGTFLPPPTDMRKRYAVKQWLYWQMAGFGPMLGQAGHFFNYAKEEVPYAKERYLKESLRLFGVLNTQLKENTFIAGDEFSIADMATYFWADAAASAEFSKDQVSGCEHVMRWLAEIAKRPAIKKVNEIPSTRD